MDIIPVGIDKVIDDLLAMDQVECPVYHKFSPGHYIRELHVKAGALCVGHIQRYDHINIFVAGKVLMLNDDGTTTILSAPMTFIGKPGRKIGMILEDMIWQNVYPTDETDVEVLEEMFFDKGQIFHIHQAHRFALEAESREADRIDYAAAIKELGFTEEQVLNQVNYSEDLCDMPGNNYKVTVAISPIAGDGIIATASIVAGEIIGEANIDGYRTPLGRYTNHSVNPSAIFVRENNIVYLVAIKDIRGAIGGYMGEEVTVDYRQARKVADEIIQGKIICQE